MTRLRNCFNKNIKLTDIDGKLWQGYVETYTPSIDSEEDCEEIGLLIKDIKLISFKEFEIKSIDIIN